MSRIARLSTSSLIFHAIEPPIPLFDCVTGQTMRLDGSWKTREGRTIFYALSSPAAHLRRPGDIEIPKGIT